MYLTLTKKQLSAVINKHAQLEYWLHELMEIMIENMMVAECGEYLIVITPVP